MAPLHVVVEDYESYKKRNRFKISHLIIFVAIALIVGFWAVKDLEKATGVKAGLEKTEKVILDSDEYYACLNSCKNVTSEEEEMTKACEIVKDRQTNDWVGQRKNFCLYKSLAYTCECMKKETEEVCNLKSQEYMKSLVCA